MFAYHDPRIRSSNGNAAEVTFVQAPVTVLKVLVVCECNSSKHRLPSASKKDGSQFWTQKSTENTTKSTQSIRSIISRFTFKSCIT